MFLCFKKRQCIVVEFSLGSSRRESTPFSLSLILFLSIFHSLSHAHASLLRSLSLFLSMTRQLKLHTLFFPSLFSLYIVIFLRFFSFSVYLFTLLFFYFPYLLFFFSSLSFKFIRSRGCDTSLGTSGYGRRLARLTEKTNFDSLAEKLAWPVYEGRHIYSSGPKDQWRKLATRPSASEATHRSSSCNNLCTILQPTTPPTI